MSRGREFEDEEVDDERIEGDEYFEDEEYEEEGEDDDDYGPGKKVVHEIDFNLTMAPWIVSDGTRPCKVRKCGTYPCLDLNWGLSSRGQGGLDLNLEIEPQDADYNPLPHLSDELGGVLLPSIPMEVVETMIVSRIPLLEFRKLCLINKKILSLVKNGELLVARKSVGVREASVFMLASGEDNWWAFDQRFSTRKTLPFLPSDIMFRIADKESLCAGTHLLVFGKEAKGPAIWTYDVLLNQWFKGTSMSEPRCLFASASSGDFAYVAGGICLETNGILNSAEKYDPSTKCWEPLPKMKEKRKMCSGFYMDNKFYVIGGQNQTGGGALTCGEVFDEDKNTWTKIPGILNGLTTSESPPLVAVVNNELYTFETSTNSLMVYLKESNTWKDLGQVPVRADLNKGWGVAFKSLGNELLVIGGSNIFLSGRGLTIYTCCPNPNAESLDWKLLDNGRNNRSPFVMNCTVMVA